MLLITIYSISIILALTAVDVSSDVLNQIHVTREHLFHPQLHLYILSPPHVLDSPSHLLDLKLIEYYLSRLKFGCFQVSRDYNLLSIVRHHD